jgi:holin-like protein
MIQALSLLLICQLLGEAVARAAALPVPGPVLGLVGLAAALIWRGGAPEALAGAADGLLRHLSLLFVPAGVGVLLHLGRIGEAWPAIGAALLLGTAATILVSAAAFRLVARWTGADDEPPGDPAEAGPPAERGKAG